MTLNENALKDFVYTESFIFFLYTNLTEIIECFLVPIQQIYHVSTRKEPTTMPEITKQELYDELSTTLTNYENHTANETDLYEMLVKIQNHWETVITAKA